jgi:hypothetical protein
MNRGITATLAGAALSLALPLMFSAPATARTYERCDADGDHCVRIKCDHDGDRCWKESEYVTRKAYARPGRWVCDHDGDRCHYVYKDREWKPRHWDRED